MDRQSPIIRRTRAGKLARAALIPLSLAICLTSAAAAADGLAPKQPTFQLAQAENSERTGYGILSELRLGAMAHDVGAFGRKEEDGVNANVEFMFLSPEFLSAFW